MAFRLVISLVCVFLVATPAHPQEVSPLIAVDTPRTVSPTVVITGQEFVQIYKIKFLDMSQRGEEVVIKEEELNPGRLGEFEVVKFEIQKYSTQKDILEHSWELKYTLKIINPEKKIYKIPALTIPWYRKKIGQDSNNAQIDTSIKTTEVYVAYVSTVILDDPLLDIRDQIDFGTFTDQSFYFWLSSILIAVVPAGLWIFFFAKYRRQRQPAKEEESLLKSTENQSVSFNDPEPVSRRKALKNLRKVIKRLSEIGDEKSHADIPQIRQDLLIGLSNLFKAEFPGLPIGLTFSETSKYIKEDSKNNAFKWNLHILAEKAASYQRDFENGNLSEWEITPRIDADRLRKDLDAMKWHQEVKRKIQSLISSLFAAIADPLRLRKKNG